MKTEMSKTKRNILIALAVAMTIGCSVVSMLYEYLAKGQYDLFVLLGYCIRPILFVGLGVLIVFLIRRFGSKKVAKQVQKMEEIQQDESDMPERQLVVLIAAICIAVLDDRLSIETTLKKAEALYDQIKEVQES